MKCYDCATDDRVAEAVGICSICGRAVCLNHATMQHLPQHRVSEAGIGGPIVRLPQERPRLVCQECGTAVGGRESGVVRGGME